MTDRTRDQRPRPSAPVLAHCAVEDTLCEVRILSEAEWDAISPAERPPTADHVAGLGWVIATPGRFPRPRPRPG